MGSLKERFIIWLSWRMPRSIVYWCSIRVFAHATVGKWGNESPCDLLCMTAIKRWSESNG